MPNDAPLPVAFCLHALGASSREFDAVAERLRGRIEVVALDLPGFGDESAAAGTTVDEMVASVIRRIRRRATGRWMLVGHSMGGKIASLVAERTLSGRSGLFGLAGIVLLAASPPSPEPMDDQRRERMLSWALDGPLDADAAREFIDGNVGAPLDAASDALMLADLQRTSPEAWRAWLDRGSREDRAAEVGVSSLPAPIVAGGGDGDLGEQGQRELNAPVYPSAPILVLPGAGHLLPLERPDEVAAAIAAFWNERAGLGPSVPADFSAMLASTRTSARTRGIHARRVLADDPEYAPRVLSADQLATLRIVADLVIPQDAPAIDLAARIDGQLAAGLGDGWRNAALPVDAEAYRSSLDTLSGLIAMSADERADVATRLVAGDYDPASGPSPAPRSPCGSRTAGWIWCDCGSPIPRRWRGSATTPSRTAVTASGCRVSSCSPRENAKPGNQRSERHDETDHDDALRGRRGRRRRRNRHRRGGAPLLATLAARGLHVVALEAGPNFEPEQHTPDELEGVDINWMSERLTAGDTPTAFGANNSGRGVGGSTLHWGAFTPRPSRFDLQLKTQTGLGADWPIPHAELVQYIERVERYIGVSGPADYPWDPGRTYPLPPTRRNASSDAMIRGCRELGIRATDAPAAVVTRDWHQPDFGVRPACASCGSCHQGCRSSAKVSMDTTYLPAAVANGAEIRPESMVHGFERDASGRITAVLYSRGGVEHRQRCATVFLCAGGVETPRLLLHTGLANSSGEVGRNFMAHGATQVWGRFPDEMRSYRGYPSSVLTEDTVRPADADFAGGYLIQSLGVQPLTLATTLARGAGMWGAGLVDAMDGYRFMAGVGINAECLPDEANLLELTDELDEHGIPKARVTFSAGGNERAIEAHAIRTMESIMAAAGATSTTVLARTAHTIGTARMGTDAATSVVDPDGRSHDVPNLWICDNSVFPSAVIANPALTIMALSLRTAERFLAA